MLRRDLASKAQFKKGRYAFLYALLASVSVTVGALGIYLEDRKLKTQGLPTHGDMYAKNARKLGNFFRSKPFDYEKDPELLEDGESSKRNKSYGIKDMFEVEFKWSEK